MQLSKLSMSAWPTTISRESVFLRIQQVGLFFCSLYLFWPSLSWMGQQITTQQHRFQLLGMVVLAGVTTYRMITSTSHTVPVRFVLNTRPFLVFVFGCVAYLLNERYIGIQVFSAAFCIVAMYGVWGFYTDIAKWHQGAVPVILLVLLLPFSDYLDVYFGFPLRMFTAQTASDMLAGLGFSTVSRDTLIVLENRFANVDLSCSGIKGLWAGLEFFMLLSWLETKSITVHWLWRLLCFSSVLIAMNIFRVALLVLLGLGFDQMAFADLVHRSLGILGFAFACLVGWGLLLTAPATNLPTADIDTIPTSNKSRYRPATYGNWPFMLLPMLFCILYTPLPKQVTGISHSLLNVGFPDDWNAQRLALTAQEAKFFPRNAAAAAKYSFQRTDTVQGSVIFVSTDYWKAHHEPKNCLLAEGYHITEDNSVRISSEKTLRMLNITKKDHKLTALYWFQTSSRTTDDFSARLFASLLDRQQHWVMVSVLLDTPEVTASDLHTVLDTFSNIVDSQILRKQSFTLNKKL